MLGFLFLKELVNAAKVFSYTSTTKFVDLRHKTVKKVSVMADYYERAVEIPECLFKDILSLEVKMVSGLITKSALSQVEEVLA